MGYQYPGQMFDNCLNCLKNQPSPGQGSLDFDAPLSSNVNINSTGIAPVAGLCVHNTAAGFEMRS